jgi:hypothetical protein
MIHPMIEKVAKAIAKDYKNNEADWSVFETSARLAIEAMKEPSEDMLEPVTNADGFFKLSDPKQAWSLMIDEILK